jgi:hypothetical protein
VVLVAEAMRCWLWRLCGAGCGGYVVLVPESMWCLLLRLCGAGCGGYVVLVVEAMWCLLLRLCVGLNENKAQHLSYGLANAGTELDAKLDSLDKMKDEVHHKESREFIQQVFAVML